jgi:putative peptidoglycan lipid II flippase
VLLPEMANLLAKNKAADANAAQNRAAAMGLLLTLPFVAAYFVIPHSIMHTIFAHGAFNAKAADVSAAALAAYGVGLPAFVLVRVTSATFYARGDTASPVRATLLAVAVNIALKIILVWGVHLGAVGIALGTALGAWANVSMLVWMALGRGQLTISPVFWRALGPILLAALMTGAGAFGGEALGAQLVPHPGFLHDVTTLGTAVAAGGACYLLVVSVFRRLLPLGRFAGTR